MDSEKKAAMRVYHFINTQYGLQVLLERRLKIARAHELNDPFEFMGMDLSEDTLREAMESMKDYYDRALGILCFSERWDNPVQWAHYADGHKGLCLGFDIPDEALTEVNYVDERMSVDEFLARTHHLTDKLGDEMDDYVAQASSAEEARVRQLEFIKAVRGDRPGNIGEVLGQTNRSRLDDRTTDTAWLRGCSVHHWRGTPQTTIDSGAPAGSSPQCPHTPSID